MHRTTNLGSTADPLHVDLSNSSEDDRSESDSDKESEAGIEGEEMDELCLTDGTDDLREPNLPVPDATLSMAEGRSGESC